MENSPLTYSKAFEHLKLIQSKLDFLEATYLANRKSLEKVYEEKFQPLYTRRCQIVNCPSSVIKYYNEPADQGEDEPAEVIGVPNFWLNAMKANKKVAGMIQKHDEDALRYLKDISCRRIEVTRDMYPNARATDGFKFEFLFDPNPYFQNSVLSMTCCMLDEDNDVMEKAIGTEIEWLPGKSLVDIVCKTRNPSGRNIKVTLDSFFNFFEPLEMPDNLHNDEGMVETVKSLMQPDYNVGVTLRVDVIPHAVTWFIVDAISSRRNANKDDNILDTFPPIIQQNVDRLLQIQLEHGKLEAMFFKARMKLDDDYLELCQPLFEKRCEIVNGGVEESAFSIGPDDQVIVKSAEEKQVQNFWLIALKGSEVVAELIEKQDEDVLKYLKDVRYRKSYTQNCIPTKSFILEFVFHQNPYFQNSTLTKSFVMIDEDYPVASVKKVIGTEIKWYPGKDLTTETDDSFFNFFTPPEMEIEDINLEKVEELEFMMKQHYNVGVRIGLDIIPHAVSYFSEFKDCADDDEFGDECVKMTMEVTRRPSIPK